MSTKLTYTVTEAAELLGISRTSAYECVRRGEIPSLTLGRRVVIPRRALEGLLDCGPARSVEMPPLTLNREPVDPHSAHATL